MPSRTQPKLYYSQGGAALLILMLMLSVGFAGMLLSARDPAQKHRAVGTVDDAVVLARARDVLLARALTDENRPGSLPCAAEDERGYGMFSGSVCDTYLGRFPHHTLDIVPFQTSDGEHIWYVLDESLRDHQNAGPINPEDKSGSLTFNGESGYAAVLIAPGPPRGDQRRDGSADVTDYLEDENQQGPAFQDCWPGDDCNDRAIGITADELFERVQGRVVRRIAAELQEFYSGSDDEPDDRYLPYAADFGSRECDGTLRKGQLALKDDLDDEGEVDDEGDCSENDGPATLEPSDFNVVVKDSEGNDKTINWMDDNKWFDLIVYHVDPQCTRTAQECSDANDIDVDGKRVQAVVAASGRVLGSQSRPGNSFSDYLDHLDNQDGGSYVTEPHEGEHNDVLIGVDVFEGSP